nr:TMV resistance protein N-like [Ipomoea trifida]
MEEDAEAAAATGKRRGSGEVVDDDGSYAAKAGTDKIEGIALNFRVVKDVKVSSGTFTHMTKLRLLKFHNANASEAPNFLPGELRWLDWHGYPSKNLPVLENLKFINLSHSQKLIRTPDFTGTPNLERLLPDELGQMECLEELYCDYTAIQKLPSSISHLKKLKILSFRGCKPLASRSRGSLFLSWLLPGTFQDTNPKVSPFPSLSGLSSLARLDLRDCSMLDGGIPSDLGALSSLEVLDLGKNKFISIPAETISHLNRLRELHLAGCEKLEALPELPSSIEEFYADECTALKGNIDIFKKCPKLFRVSLTKCDQILDDPRYSHMIDAIWQHLLKGLSLVDDDVCICFPGTVIPEWFTYKNWGPSISVDLPQNWYNNKFMGFAFCAVSDLINTKTSESHDSLSKTYGIDVQFSFKTISGRKTKYGLRIGYMGTKQNADCELTCLAFMSFDGFWASYSHEGHSPNEWCEIEVSSDGLTMVYTGFGMRLVYEDDVIESDKDVMMIHTSSSSSSSQSVGKMGLFPAIFDGSWYVKKKRACFGYPDVQFSRLPPEAFLDS